MMQAYEYVSSALFEHRFWLQVAGDHSWFIKNALAPDELQEIQRANHFIQAYDDVMYQARDQRAAEQLDGINRDAYRLTQELRVC